MKNLLEYPPGQGRQQHPANSTSCFKFTPNTEQKRYLFHPRYMYLICAAVKINSCDQWGMPVKEEALQLERLEQRIMHVLDRHHQSLLAASLTCCGYHTFFCYTCMPDHCEKQLKRVKREWSAHLLGLSRHQDQGWEYLKAFL